MNVTFANFGDEIASSRLRASIPQKELSKMGIGIGKDVLIYGKHFLDIKATRGFGKVIYDICDDHFKTPDLSDYYRKHAENADLLTCNSYYMQKRIREETGRFAYLVSEPYEGIERKPAIAAELFWYGHKSNLVDLERIVEKLDYPIHVLTNMPGFVPWTPDNMEALMSMPSIVIIPTGKSLAKSENRMVEAIRGGHYVCAEYLPSYEPFSPFFKLGDIPSHIEHALHNPEAAIKKIEHAQAYIADRYSPRTIAKRWLEVIHGN